MNFPVDAQLPRRLARHLLAAGHDAVHTLDLPLENRTPDHVLCDLSMVQKRIVVTKDVDFVDSFILHGAPYKLLLVSTGNIHNDELLELLVGNLDALVHAFTTHSFVEIDRHTLTIHA